MLVLTRGEGQEIMIGDDVKITVVGVKGNRVKLGIMAPKEIAVNRIEVYEAIKRDCKQAEDVSGGNGERLLYHEIPRGYV
jgi:carbon storage regulator